MYYIDLTVGLSMRCYKYLILFLSISFSLTSSEFTVASYNCGGLSDHYDYLRAASMQKLMQERYTAEPAQMALNENIQKLALKILFAADPQEKLLAEQEWELKDYQLLFEKITSVPKDLSSPNYLWHQKAEGMITSYKERPIVISDASLLRELHDHCMDLTRSSSFDTLPLLEVRSLMAKRIFANHLSFDIICLQEANYLDNTLFPDNYAVQFSETPGLKSGVAWNSERFELIESLGSPENRGLVVKLRDKESGKSILVASGHITGCNPFCVELDPVTGAPDSAKGDTELQAIVDLFQNTQADLKLIGMDSNVTSLHPRLNILKKAGYQIDYENFIEATCTNPYQVLNTRIDWIAIKGTNLEKGSITNIPVLSVGLNHLQTNISDHKPIAARISY